MGKLKERKIQILSRNGQPVIAPTSPSKSFGFFRFFSSSRGYDNQNKGGPDSREPVLRGSHLKVSRKNLGTVQNWVALEEKIVHDYQERVTGAAPRVPVRNVMPATKVEHALPLVKPEAPKPEVKEEPLISESFNTQTITPSPVLSFPKKSSPEKSKPGIRGALVMIAGWMAAIFFIFLFAQEYSSHQNVSLQLAQVWGEKKQLERFYNDLKATMDGQRLEIQRLNTQVRTMTGELRAAKQKAQEFDAMERSYRDELLRVTAHYEQQLESLRQLIQIRDQWTRYLHSHTEAIEKLISQGGLKTAFTDTLKSLQAQQEMSSSAAPVARAGVSMPDGKVMMVNSRYEFVVVDIGSNQGAREGRKVNIFQNGKKPALGKIERVYPAMSAVTMLDSGVLNSIQEGDSVSFSS